MRRIPRITQENVHIFIPHKVAYITDRMRDELGIGMLESISMFYRSNTYRLLERESTKLWQDNVKQLYADFLEEMRAAGKL